MKRRGTNNKADRNRDEAGSDLLDGISVHTRRLARFTTGLPAQELRWRPRGINNSMEWILTHLTAELWVCCSVVTGSPMTFNPLGAVPALASWRGIPYGPKTSVPTPDTDDPTRKLTEAWNVLREALQSPDIDLEQHMRTSR